MRTFVPLLALATTISIADAAPADEGLTLPIFTTELEAVNALESALKDSVSKAGVTLDSSKPTEPLRNKPFVGIGIQVHCSGSLAQTTAFLEDLDRIPFGSLPMVKLNQDRREPTVMRTSIEIRQWYAAKEKGVSKVKKWRRVAKTSPSPSELFRTCSDALPDEGVSITSFSDERGQVTMIGQAKDAHAGRVYGAALFEKADELHGYHFQWIVRPTVDQRRKDGAATLRIQLAPKAPAAARG